MFQVLHKGLRKATLDLICCNFRTPRADNEEEEEEGGEGAGDEDLPMPPPPLNGSGRNAYIDGSLGAVNRTYM